jgi:hypothetical protein
MRKNSSATLIGGLALGALLGMAAPARAQIDTGSILGTVSDESGAALAGATITATHEGTGVAVTVTANDRGQYVFPNLKIGRYTVAAEMQGFRRAVRLSLDLHVQDRAQTDFRLGLGNRTEEVVVRGKAELLQTQSADMGHSVDQRQVTDLPLLGRRYAELALLTTGVVPSPVGLAQRGDDTFFNVNGNPGTWNNFTLDGADNNSFSTNLQERSPQVIQPPVDALEEFRVQTRTYSAEFGKAAGAVINASIKQGSNSLRGSVFEFFRDEAFNANTWENRQAGRSKGKFNQHIAGATLGGPIVKNRVFFFADYQATRTDKALTQLATVPTPLMRQGNLTELQRALRGSPFVPAGCLSGNVISPGCLDPVALELMKLYPLPNIPQAMAAQGRAGGFVSPNFISNGVLHNDVDQFDVRVDTSLRDGKDQLFARYSFMNTERHEPPTLENPVASGDFSSDIFNKGRGVVGGWSRIFSSSVFSEVRVSWNRIKSDSLQPSFGTPASQFGIRGVPEDPRFAGGIPHTNIAGLTRLGGPFFRPQFQTSQVYQLSGNLTWHRGRHTFKAGLERRRDKVDYIDLRALNGLLTFSDARYTNSGIGDFLLGLASAEGLTLFHEPHLFTDGWQVYAQDSWRPRPKVALNYGLRYEYFTPMQDRDNVMTNVIPETGEIVTAKDSGGLYDRTLVHPDRNNFAPRIGLVYTATPRLVLRGGYGIFYQETDRYGSESQLALNPPQLIDVNLNANSVNDPPVMILRNGFAPVSAANVSKAAVQWRIQDPNQRTPMVHQFSLGPEVGLTSNMALSVEYVGNLTRNGRRLRNLNQGMITGPSTVVFPYSRYGFGSAYLEQIVTIGRVNYHALQAKLQRRFTGGLGFTLAFTYSRTLGDYLDHLTAGFGASGNNPQNAYNMSADYGPLAYDVPKRFVASFIYELPVGGGRRFNPGGVGGALLRDWSINGILSLNDGMPFTITSTDRSNTGPGHISRANCNGDAQPSGFDRTITRWFDTSVFSEPAAFNFGTCGQNTVRGPGSKSMNLSLFRRLPIGGERRVELRVEGFNVFNWTNYGFPGMSVSNTATFGRISSSLGDPREVQLALKLYF